MAYTPEISQYQSAALRRIAWALDIPMTKAMNSIIQYITDIIDHERICKACRDKSQCVLCVFNQKNHKKEHSNEKQRE
ncbi:conserved hypothetical protein [Desulfamplus magnetovallimortis]|uniref:Uncharacterized protein n=1 Tax=Desulfamplus magnetovallimortis TaxID=1246637 RepID=A0A1W1HEP2_9BACT|nr:hypothetical protein [Desulfamplus magnetovallimortis]SLM30858.1 conserved hypothetical protein [Desulfamplus magnetovallimortis]